MMPDKHGIGDCRTVRRITQLSALKGLRKPTLPTLDDIEVVKREPYDRVMELIEANNRELERRRALCTAMEVILMRSNCAVTRELARKALAKDEAMARGVEGN